MTPERKLHLELQISTIQDPEEMGGFIKGLKESNEYTTDIAQACRDHAKGKGWE